MSTDKKNQYRRTLGLAKKAGKIIAGTELVINKIRSGGAKNAEYAVFFAEDISAATKKKLTDKCAFYNTPLYPAELMMSELSHAIGLDRLCAAVLVTLISVIR